ncbi:MAG TPA: SpoIIE family protein phosphatase [Terracidiphilus sp.]|nr:SpoIIE family protein phosphatase [Terracidiphilus sp.]
MSVASVIRRIATVALLAHAAWLTAQSYDLDRGREPLVSLDGLWRFHPGDSPDISGSSTPLWASSTFDDSHWELLRGDTSWTFQGHPAMSGYAWYRFTIKVPAEEPPVSILLAPIVTSFEIYTDGRLAGGSGDMPPTHTPNTRFSFHLFPLTREASSVDRTVQVAIRVWHSPMWSSYVGGGPFQPGNLAGAPKLLASEQRHHQLARNVIFVDQYAYSITAGLVGLVILCLFLMRPGEREYLWFAVVMLAQAFDSALNVLQAVYSLPPVPVYDLLDGGLNALDVTCLLLFLATVLRARLRVGRRVLLVLLALSPLMGVLYWTGVAPVPVSAALQLLFMLPAMVWILYLLVLRAMRGNQDARLLLLPIFLSEGYWTADNLIILLAQAGWLERPRVMEVPLPLPPFTIHVQVLVNLVFLLAMMVFLIRRFTLARRQEERMAGELEAARQVQQVLLPDELDQCPGFAVACIYQPADEVGGDFFQQMADSNGGMLIVVGDVSGKGLPAAMLVSVLVGAIRAEASHGSDPARLMRSLNERMLGRSQGGFTTCLAAHISAQGHVTLANAGHLAPYLNGHEIGVPGSLPLGIVAQPEYESNTVKLAPGDRLTFVSDGVVEAQTRSGELFGFDRTRNISRRPAEEIARAAQDFGQKDDITVVTVEFAGAPNAVLV